MFYNLLIISCIVQIGELINPLNLTYCTQMGPCPANKCCQQIARGLFSNVGTCENLPIDGEPCDINCPCSEGYKCQLNPLCAKCSAICMKNSMIQKLSDLLNKGCYDQCQEFDHLFKPKPRIRVEGDLCNAENKCSDSFFCAPNILCKQCDYICMNEDFVKSLLLYFEKGCENNCIGQARGIPDILVSKYDPNKIPLDKNGLVVFPEFY